MKLQRNQSGKRQWTMLAPLLVLIGALWFTPLTASAQVPVFDLNNVPVTGTLGRAGTFVGDLSISGFSVIGRRVLVTGVLNGTVTTARGVITEILGQELTNVVARLLAAEGTCDVLFLDIRPIFLDLLGLQVHLDRVTLDIDAVTGSGNLLGNLLCTIVQLLD